MDEHMARLRTTYPAIDDLLRRVQGKRLLDYLGQIRHRSLPDILPADDLLVEMQDYFTPFFGTRIAKEAAGVAGRRRCLSTANHHHPAFEYMTVQDTLLSDQWVRMHGETGNVVPFLAASNVNLTSAVYPRGMVVYDCTLPEGQLRLPLYPWTLKRTCVAAMEGIAPPMVDKALHRLRQEVQRNSITVHMADALERFCREVLLSGRVQQYGTLREQTTVINAMLSERYFTDRRPQYLWMPLETLAARLLIRDLQRANGILAHMLFCQKLRSRLLRALDGVSGCWTGNSGGTHFFWGLDRRAILFPLRLREMVGGPVLMGRNSLGEDVTVPFTPAALMEELLGRTLLPGLFVCFLEIHFLRDFTVLGGYYQPTYLSRMQEGIVDVLRRSGDFSVEAGIIAQKTDYMTLGLVYLLRNRGAGAFPVSTAELLEQPIPTATMEASLGMPVADSIWFC